MKREDFSKDTATQKCKKDDFVVEKKSNGSWYVIYKKKQNRDVDYIYNQIGDNYFCQGTTDDDLINEYKETHNGSIPGEGIDEYLDSL